MDTSVMQGPIYFLGGGNMATAIMNGLSRSMPNMELVVCDPSDTVRERHQEHGHKTYANIADCRDVQCVVLAVKPQYFPGAIQELAQAVTPKALMISVMAGISTASIESSFPDARVIRAMPNTPMAVSKGMVGLTKGRRATESDLEFTTAVFASSGKVLHLEESKMNAITAVSGSGPAYFFRFCEVMQAAAQELGGFTESEAQLLVSQTAQGAMAYLAAQEGFPVARLRREVTSPGGTTEAALTVLEQGDLKGLVHRAIGAAIQRGQELDEQNS